MPRKDGTGPKGQGQKKSNAGTPTPKKDGSGQRKGQGSKGRSK